MVRPIIYKQLPIHKETPAVISTDTNMMDGIGRSYLAPPANRKMILGYAGSGGTGPKIKIHHGIDASEDGCAGEVHVIKILTPHAGFVCSFNVAEVLGFNGP
jgi:hypothetical protein